MTIVHRSALFIFTIFKQTHKYHIKKDRYHSAPRRALWFRLELRAPIFRDCRQRVSLLTNRPSTWPRRILKRLHRFRFYLRSFRQLHAFPINISCLQANNSHSYDIKCLYHSHLEMRANELKTKDERDRHGYKDICNLIETKGIAYSDEVFEHDLDGGSDRLPHVFKFSFAVLTFQPQKQCCVDLRVEST
ncbi:hypothetical protein PanWU01x14_242200 [Parasponia andersonii]|uniref:Uncharacterized protein n=1 Tax=Parasponia andersonii TaxID=3476 RepID=A0A2P5BG48_PARAD|nr:hypothetical protein PanWU01x14_242200 [Parasponia andersonii]